MNFPYFQVLWTSTLNKPDDHSELVPIRLFGCFARSECETALPLLLHWMKLRCHPITAAVCRVHRPTQNALQKPHVRTYLGVLPSQGKRRSSSDTFMYEHAVFSLILQTHWTTGCRRVTMCWDIPLVWCRGPESRMGLRWSTARRTRGATLTEVCVLEVSTWCCTPPPASGFWISPIPHT